MFAFRMLTFDLANEHLVPAGGAVDVPRAKFRRETVALGVEQEQRVVTDGLEMPVVRAAFLLPMDRTSAGIHVEADVVVALYRFNLADEVPLNGYRRLLAPTD